MNFAHSDYQNLIAKAQSNENGSSVKIGFFKMKNDKDEALVRFNIRTLDDLQFATVHQLGAAQKWMKVSCLNPVGSYQDSCPLCAAVSAGNNSIGKASKKVYVQMMISYKDAATQQFSAAIPVIWERPAGFSREIANLIKDYGDLTNRVFKITRNGAAGNMQTTYSISYIPLYDKPECVTNDFSAFTNFNIAKHSFWEKTLGDINVFLNTGSFPEVARAPQAPMPTDADAPAYVRNMTTPVPQAPATPFNAPANIPEATTPYVAPVTPAAPQYVPNVTTTPFVAPVTPATTLPWETPAAPTTPVTPTPAAAPAAAPQAPATQPVGSEFGRAPRTFGGLSF
jgi:hypothetical protein